MGELLLHNPWVQFYLLYVAALVVVNVVHATMQQSEPAEKTASVGVEPKAEDRSRRRGRPRYAALICRSS